jgi:hypothetical protein
MSSSPELPEFRLLFIGWVILSSVRRLLTTFALLGLVAGVAACGSSSPASTSLGSASFNSPARFQARLKLAECFRSHGLNVPDPSPTGGVGAGLRALQNYPQSQIRTVLQECHSDAVQAFPALNLSPAERAQLQQELVKFAECMRSHGVNIPDPTNNGGGAFGFRQAFRAVDRNSPAFRSALTACRSTLPRRGRFGG